MHECVYNVVILRLQAPACFIFLFLILVCLFLALSLGLLLSLEFLNWPALVVARCCFLVSTSCSRQHSTHCSIL